MPPRHRSRSSCPTPAIDRAEEPHVPKPLVQTTGRRKQAIARVRIRAGSGKIVVNGRPIEDYFPSETHRMVLGEPLRATRRFCIMIKGRPFGSCANGCANFRCAGKLLCPAPCGRRM